MNNNSLPEELGKAKNEQYIYLTTVGRKTGRTYTKELWFAVSDGKVYLSHEGDHTDWMKNVSKSPSVQFKIGSSKFAAKARLTNSNDPGREIGKTALYEKYYGPASKEKIDDWFELSTVIELNDVSSV